MNESYDTEISDIIRETLMQGTIANNIEAARELQNYGERVRFLTLLQNMDDDEFA